MRLDLDTSPLSLLRRIPNQVLWKRHLRMCLGGLLIRGRPRQVVAELLRDEGCVRASVAPPPCGTLPSREVCRLGSCNVYGLSYPQPPDRSPQGCTVGIDRDPPV